MFGWLKKRRSEDASGIQPGKAARGDLRAARNPELRGVFARMDPQQRDLAGKCLSWAEEAVSELETPRGRAETIARFGAVDLETAWEMGLLEGKVC